MLDKVRRANLPRHVLECARYQWNFSVNTKILLKQCYSLTKNISAESSNSKSAQECSCDECPWHGDGPSQDCMTCDEAGMTGSGWDDIMGTCSWCSRNESCVTLISGPCTETSDCRHAQAPYAECQGGKCCATDLVFMDPEFPPDISACIHNDDCCNGNCNFQFEGLCDITGDGVFGCCSPDLM